MRQERSPAGDRHVKESPSSSSAVWSTVLGAHSADSASTPWNSKPGTLCGSGACPPMDSDVSLPTVALASKEHDVAAATLELVEELPEPVPKGLDHRRVGARVG